MKKYLEFFKKIIRVKNSQKATALLLQVRSGGSHSPHPRGPEARPPSAHRSTRVHLTVDLTEGICPWRRCHRPRGFRTGCQAYPPPWHPSGDSYGGSPQVWVADSGERSARGDARRGSRMGGPAESDGGRRTVRVVWWCRVAFGLVWRD